MKKVKLFLGVILVGILLTPFGCVKNNTSGPETPPLPESEYFNFATRQTTKLNINYNLPGHQAHIEIYDENPVDIVNGAYVKKNIRPVYSAFTDKNGKLTADMYIPTAVSEAYMYTSTWGFPICVKLNTTVNGFEYDSVKDGPFSPVRPATKAAMDNFTNNIPYKFGTFNGAPGLQLFSICKWDANGQVGKNQTGDDYLSVATNAGKSNETIGAINDRVQAFFDATPNKKETFLANEGETNIQVLTNDTELDITLIVERGSFANSVGYYYYKAGNAPQSREELWKHPKYILFPDASIENLRQPMGATARLQFFGENYDQPATSKFPAGYVIGWFFISDGFSMTSGSLANAWMATPTNTVYRGQKTMFYSNDKANDNGKDNRRFVTLNDTKSGLTILGFEDQVEVNEKAEDYSDVLFFVTASKEIDNPGPIVPDPDPTPQVKTLTLSGTAAFEDIWPYGGDYDLNDVAVAYERVIRYNDNNNDIVDITESFTYKHAAGAAAYNNFFAIQVANEGTAQTLSEGMEYEAATKSFIITKSAKESGHPTYSVTRTFAAGTHKDVISNDFNPYIIVGKTTTTTPPKADRVEVHLPKQKATSLAKALAGTGDDAYYVKKDGSYPFAIDINEDGQAVPFILAKEMVNIGVAYPKFNSWASSKGTQDKDWYNHPATPQL